MYERTKVRFLLAGSLAFMALSATAQSRNGIHEGFYPASQISYNLNGLNASLLATYEWKMRNSLSIGPLMNLDQSLPTLDVKGGLQIFYFYRMAYKVPISKKVKASFGPAFDYQFLGDRSLSTTRNKSSKYDVINAFSISQTVELEFPKNISLIQGIGYGLTLESIYNETLQSRSGNIFHGAHLFLGVIGWIK